MAQQTSFTMVVSLEFDKIYTGIARPSIPSLFVGIPTNSIMEVIGHFNAMIYTNEMEDKVQMDILRVWLGRLPHALVRSVSSAIAQIVVQNGRFVFYSNQTSLLFIEKALSNYNPGETRNLTPIEEESIFKAYLLVAQEWIDNQKKSFDTIKLNSPEEIVKFALPVILPFDDLKSFRDFRWQIYKAIKLFKYFDNHPVLNTHLKLFYDHYKVKDWNNYLLHIVGSIVNLFQAGSKSILLTEKDDPINQIMDQLSIDIPSYSTKIDFIGLREKPVYKCAECRYVIYNYSLFIDKIFQAIQFDFGNILKLNGIVKSIPDFKSSFISKYFFEQFFLYNEVSYIIGNRKKSVSFNGAEWEKQTGVEGPDYYARCGTKLFLTEFKDAIFKAEAKLSHNFDEIKVELNKKLKENEKGSPKGISQLASWVNEITEKGIEFDKFDINEINIYPLLIITDEAYNSFGINYLMNVEYRSLLTQKANSRSENLIIIHIDKIIELQDLLHDKKAPIQWLLDWYIQYTSKPNSPLDRFLSFSHFISGELHRRGYKYNSFPRELEKELPQLFKSA